MLGKTAFLFPGQGSQSLGMGKSAWNASAKARELMESADRQLGFSLSDLMFNGPDEKLRDTTVTQPALFVASAMAGELLKERSIRPEWVAGHSLGEYSALYAAGVLFFEDALALVRERGQAMQQAAERNPGAMAAVIGLTAEKLSEICSEVSKDGRVCVAANLNSTSQIVLSGHQQAVTEAADAAKRWGAAKVVMLPVSGAFHSPLMEPAVARMQTRFETVSFRDSVVPVITNVDAKPTHNAADFKSKLLKQIEHSVLWHTTMETLNGLGAESLIEVGAGKVLSTLAKKFDRKKHVFCTDEINSLDQYLSVARAN